MIKAGEMNELSILRKSDLGYMLTDGKEEILLHFKESDKELNIGDKVEVFIYFDSKNRMTATTHSPYATILNPGFAKVVEVVSNLGVFVNINTPKDVLIPLDYLPYDKQMWPDIDDMILINLKIKKDSFIAKPLNRYDILDLPKTKSYEKDDVVDGYVIRPGVEGVGIVTKDMQYIFVHKTHLRRVYRLGEFVTPKIIMVKKNEYNGSLTQNKELMIGTDEEIILNYLRAHDGVMSLTAKSSSEEVEQALKLSRKAFKRALGSLYKEHKVDCLLDKTILLKK
jgi:predicted RNA-binding protein (virulence factor B family)